MEIPTLAVPCISPSFSSVPCSSQLLSEAPITVIHLLLLTYFKILRLISPQKCFFIDQKVSQGWWRWLRSANMNSTQRHEESSVQKCNSISWLSKLGMVESEKIQVCLSPDFPNGFSWQLLRSHLDSVLFQRASTSLSDNLEMKTQTPKLFLKCCQYLWLNGWDWVCLVVFLKP